MRRAAAAAAIAVIACASIGLRAVLNDSVWVLALVPVPLFAIVAVACAIAAQR